MVFMKFKDFIVDYLFNIIGRFILEIGFNRFIICLFFCLGLNGEGWFDFYLFLVVLK